MYQLINNTTKEEIICSLVTIDGFDYYVEDREPTASHALLDNCYYIFNNKLYKRKHSHHVDCKLVLCTNNSNIDIPKVIDELDSLVEKDMENNYPSYPAVFRRGYSKAKETYQFTEEDMIEFTEWCNKPSEEDIRQPNTVYIPSSNFYWHKHKKYTPKELLQLFKEQQIKTIYYE